MSRASRADLSGALAAPSDHQPESLLVRRLAAGELEALAELYDRHAGAVYSLAFSIAGDAAVAEDITQDVFVKVWRQARLFEPASGALAQWLLTITHTRARARQA